MLKVHPQGPTSRGFSSAVFANHQFCRVSGFSMVRATNTSATKTNCCSCAVCAVCA